ncbi:hypothetical protein ICM05_05360 [Leucobacter sp. cx-42]|uniref:hypothetical protein n=1 Tax=unclassified Leucobacter TaxID=2621730 RepID=UPI00165E822B|nr:MULTISPECIES: hypothetical protein [unclassified Leucobacter]MBC9954074.1 hypothetical protein [Leucobacter sp. cx-42]
MTINEMLSDETIDLFFAFQLLEEVGYAPTSVEAFLRRGDLCSSETFLLKISDETFPNESLKYLLKTAAPYTPESKAIREAIAKRSDLSPNAMYDLGIHPNSTHMTQGIQTTTQLLAEGVENDRLISNALSEYLVENLDKWLHSELDECGGECECYDAVIESFYAEPQA